MKKNQFYWSVALVLASSTVALGSFTGLYVGGVAGPAFLEGTHQYTNGTSQAAGKQKVKAFSYVAGLNGGYLRQMGDSKLVLGAELYGLFCGNHASKDLQMPSSTIDGKISIRHKMTMGASIIIGGVMNPKVLVYTRLGLELDKFELKYTSLTFGTIPTQKFSKSVRATVPGLGALYKISDSLLVGAEYTYALMTKIEPRSDKTVINGAQRGYMYTPSEQRVVVKVSYLF